MGRVCSALPGSTADGMGAPNVRHDVPAAGNGALSIPVLADPTPEASSVTGGRVCRVLDACRQAYPHVGGRWRSRGGAGRRQERRPERSREPARRSGAQPGLDEVEKVLSRCDELLAVVAPHVRAVAVQGVQEADRVDLCHALADFGGCEPGDGCGLA